MSEMQIEGQAVEVSTQPLAWELTAPEIIFPFTWQIGPRTLSLFVHMKPYRADDLKTMLAETAPAVKFEDEDTQEIVKSKPEKIQAFFWKHFIRISGHGRAAAEGDLDIEKQKEWIRNNPRLDIPSRTVLEGFGGISTKRPEQSEEEPVTNGNGDHHPEIQSLELLTMDLDVSTQVPLQQRVALFDVGIVMLEMQHNFRRETASEYQRYERATDKQILNRKRQALQRTVQHSVIEDVYGAVIESVDGMTYKGQPCNKDSKDKWVREVPYWHKQLALIEFFSGVQSKNG